MRTILALIICAGATAIAVAEEREPTSSRTTPYVLFLNDNSKSILKSDPPATTQSVILQFIGLAKLSQQPIRFGCIQFGSTIDVYPSNTNGFTGDFHEIGRELRDKWKSPHGATRMDEALEVALRICRTIPNDAHLTVVLMSDGYPASGRLRPEDFPAVQQEIETRRKAILQKYAGHPAKTIQEALQLLENRLRNPESEEFREIYQRQDELQRAIETVQTLKREFVNLRFITISLTAEDSPITEIHESASGRPQDFVQTDGHGLLKALDSLRITSVPRVVQLDHREFVADNDSFERRITVPLDEVAEAALISIEFHKGIERFQDHLELVAEVDGSLIPMRPEHPSETCYFTFDGKGDAVTATLCLESIPLNNDVEFRLESPDGSMHMPACTLHTHFRLRSDLLPDLRPEIVPREQPPPYLVSPQQKTVWRFALRNQHDRQAVRLDSAFAVLTHRRAGDQVSLGLETHPQIPNEFLSKPHALEAGVYDVELKLRLHSGKLIQLPLSQHIECALSEGVVRIDYPMPSSGRNASFSRKYIDFGVLGDVVLTHRVKLTIWTEKIPFPITVNPSVLVTDQGDIPHQAWITFDRTKLTLHPGRTETLFMTARIPKEMESGVRNGLFEGRLTLTDVDSGLPYPMERSREVAGTTDEDIPERVTLTLRRPEFVVESPRCFRNWIEASGDGEFGLPLNVTIHNYFNRMATVTVSHTSKLPRTVTVVPSALFFTREGLQVDTIRLTPLGDRAETTREIAPNSSETWLFLFEVDDSCDIQSATGSLDITADGVVPAHINLRFTRSNPLLRPWIEFIGYVIAVISLLSALIPLAFRWSKRKLRGQQLSMLKAGKSVGSMLSLNVDQRDNPVLESRHPVEFRRATDTRWKRVSAGSAIPIPADIADNALHVRVRPESGSSIEFEIDQRIHEGTAAQVRTRILENGDIDRRMDIAKKRTRRRVTLSIAAVCIAYGIRFLIVIQIAQWIADFLSF